MTTPRTREESGVAPRAQALGATARPPSPDGARLLDVAGAARYLSVSVWCVKDLLRAGRLPRVRLPLAGDRGVRRLLVDRADLDRLIESSKEAG